MFCGGLKVISSRYILDILTLSIQCGCILISIENTNNGSFNSSVSISSIDKTVNDEEICHDIDIAGLYHKVAIHIIIMFASFVLTIVTSDMSVSNRWTITFPLIPNLVLQCFLRPYVAVVLQSPVPIIQTIIFALSISLLIISTLLSLVLFPPLQLPELSGKYNVGILDLHLPPAADSKKDNNNKEYVSVRLMYPTNEPCNAKENIPYLNPLTSIHLCAETMKAGAPPPLQSFGWMLHYWRLIKLPRTKYNASPIEAGKLPLVIFSHGLGGTASMYTHQTANLASTGSVVCSINHTDGSAPIVERSDGSLMFRNDKDAMKLWLDGKKEDYVRQRRKFTDHRADEFIQAALSFIQLCSNDNKGIKDVGNKALLRNAKGLVIDTSDVTFMGHSFGGATAITASHRYPNLVSNSLVAYDPALDWAPDDARRSLFSEPKLRDSIHSYDGGTGGYEDELDNENKDFNDSQDEKKEEKQDMPPQRRNSNNNNNNPFLSFIRSFNKNDNNNDDDHDDKSICKSPNDTEMPLVTEATIKSCVHDVDMLILYSNDWYETKWGGSALVECIYKRGELGCPKTKLSEFDYIAKSKHNEFSDVCMLTPLWLARAVGSTSKERNPIDTSNEISQRTITYLNTVRKEKHIGK